ncbi:MAG: DUF4255 domain-containing protein [Candidatus Marinimicrobia bacterium]|nr:DUF4255 domain-containing protein [Candidatus Neomarinimicrobiota bacterium]
MSDYRAIAAVTATLRQLIEEAVSTVPGVGNVKITTSRPDAVQSVGSSYEGVNIYLYQVQPNAAFRNSDLPTRSANGNLVQRSSIGLDLSYLLNFYGNDDALTSQLLLGRIVGALHSRPVLTRAAIADMVLRAPDESTIPDYLSESDLEEQIDLVKFTPVTLDIEELSKLWSVFFQTPYTLSMAYYASVVLIDGEQTPPPVLPVGERTIQVGPFPFPVIKRINGGSGPGGQILAGDELLVLGHHLDADEVEVRIGNEVVSPQEISGNRLKVRLPAQLRAGTHGLRVSHGIMMGVPPVSHQGAESNVVPFVLHPFIAEDAAGQALVSFTQPPKRGRRSSEPGMIDLELAPPVYLGQVVVLLLNELSESSPRAFTLPAPVREDETNSLQIPAGNVSPGTYLVRVQVDGVSSPFSIDEAGRFSGPQVTVT